MPTVFLSHSSKDKELARQIARDLRAADIDVWLDECRILIGDSIAHEIQQGLEEADFVAILLTDHSINSGWVEKEWQSQVGREAATKQVCILPLKASECDIPLLLRDKRYADFTSEYKPAIAALIAAIQQHTSRRLVARKNNFSLTKEEKTASSDSHPSRDAEPETSHGVTLPGSSMRGIDFQALIDARTELFVGRRFLFDAIDRCLNDPLFPGGYILLYGEPGIGKTAFAAQYIKDHDCIHYFNISQQNIRSSATFLTNICHQIASRYRLWDFLPPNTTFNDSSVLSMLLREASSRSATPILVVIDALDEAELPPDPSINRLCLPAHVPDGVYFLVTSRPAEDILLQVDRICEIHIHDTDLSNLEDINNFVEVYLQWKPALREKLENSSLDQKTFTRLICERSQGNFMYVVSILRDLIVKPIPISLEQIPRGLLGYYQKHWRLLRAAHPDEFDGIYKHVFGFLCIAREPISVEDLQRWTDISAQKLRQVISHGRQFLEEISSFNEASLYYLYHNSFRDFLVAEIGSHDFHLAFSNAVLRAITSPFVSEKSDRSALSHYELNHLIAHLQNCGRYEAVHEILRRSRDKGGNWWYHLKDASNDIAGFREDLNRATEVMRLQAPSAHPPIAKQVRYSLMAASVASLSRSYEIPMLAALVRFNIWPFCRVLAHARYHANIADRVKALIALADCAPLSLREAIIRESLEYAMAATSNDVKIDSLIALLPHLEEGSQIDVCSSLFESTKGMRTWQHSMRILQTLSTVNIQIDTSRILGLGRNLLRTKLELSDDQSDWELTSFPSESRVQMSEHRRKAERDWQRCEFGKLLINVALKSPMDMESLYAEAVDSIQDIESEWYRRELVQYLWPHVRHNSAFKDRCVASALSISEDEERVKALLSLLKPLGQTESDFRERILAEAINVARGLDVNNPKLRLEADWIALKRAEALATLLPYVEDVLRTRLLNEAIAAVDAVGERLNKFVPLITLSPYLAADNQKAVWALKHVRFNQAFGDSWPAAALAAIVRHLKGNEPLLKMAISTARSFNERRYRAASLVACAENASERQREQLLREALELLTTIDDRRIASNTISALCQHVTTVSLVYPETVTRLIKSASEVAVAKMFREMIVHSDQRQRKHLLNVAIDTIREQGAMFGFAYSLVELAPVIPKRLLGTLLQDAFDATYIHSTVPFAVLDATGAIAPLVGKNGTALNHVYRCLVQESDSNAEATPTHCFMIAQILPYLSGARLQRAFLTVVRCTQQIPEVSALRFESRSQILKLVARAVPNDRALSNQFLDCVASMREEWARLEVFCALCNAMGKEGENATLARMVDVAVSFSDVDSPRHNPRAIAITRLRPLLDCSPLLLRRALAAVDALNDRDNRECLRAGELARMGDTRAGESAARQILDIVPRISGLAEIALRSEKDVRDRLLEEIIEQVELLRDQETQSVCLEPIVPLLASHQKLQIRALLIVDSFTEIYIRPRVASGIINVVPESAGEDVITAIIRVIANTEDEDARAKILRTFASWLQRATKDAAIDVFGKLFDALSTRSRSGLLKDLENLAPILAYLESERCLLECIQVIEEVIGWWP